ncbi:gliding motility-associated C-terminal domain-containing protein [candidate division KSB1 bacterium]|nr:gliding motility-associated C-terminal domain-containing protein [candidate division KSB1 bacterium]
MKKRTITQILLSLIFISLCTELYPATIKILNRQAPPGNIVNVPITLSNADSLAGLEFILQYDAGYLDFIRIDSMNLAEDFFIDWKQKENKIAVTMAKASGLSQGSGTLFELVFRIKSSVQIGETTDIFWVQASLFNEATVPMICETIDGKIKVSELSVFPNPFTPNKDGFNDVVNFIVADSLINETVVAIFDIKGNKIIEITQNTGAGLQWDGTNETGTELIPGVYLYIMKRKNETFHKGTITLMR